MKKLFLLSFLVFAVLSCDTEDDSGNPNFYNEILPVESVIMPEYFELGNTHEIRITYIRPSGCHLFSDFYYLSELNQRTIAIIATVLPDQVCQPSGEEIEVTFNFRVNDIDPYVFKFWQGEDENGNDLFYVVEVPVEN